MASARLRRRLELRSEERLVELEAQARERFLKAMSGEEKNVAPFHWIDVDRETWRGLHRSFDRGDPAVFTGKKDGTNRRVERLTDGRIVEVLTPTPAVRKCAGCGASEGSVPGVPKHKPCSRCRVAYYCSVGCQTRHWKTGGHREDCVAGAADRRAAEEVPREVFPMAIATAMSMSDVKLTNLTRHGQGALDSYNFTNGQSCSTEYIYDKDGNVAGTLSLSGKLYLKSHKAPKHDQVCDVCAKPTSRRCSRCRTTFFCSAACMAASWRAGHKKSCEYNKRMRDMYDAAAAAGEFPVSAASGLFRWDGTKLVPFTPPQVRVDGTRTSD